MSALRVNSVRSSAVGGRMRHADADPDEDMVAVDLEGSPDGFDDPFAKPVDVFRLLHVRQYDRELVAADATRPCRRCA